ncbi:MAG TPA: L-rhamnose/proton symporter RhaT [Acidobacteriaceae bacterium]
MGLNPFSGVILLAIGGLCSATNFIPFRQIKRWSWEVYWIVQSFAAWIVLPALAACFFVPNCCGILHQAWPADAHSIWLALLFGMVWGVGGMAFGLAIRYLGIALGYAISLGFGILFAALLAAFQYGPIARAGNSTIHSILLGLIAIAGVALSGAAARRKELEMTLEVKLEAGEQDYHFPKGLAMAALSGLAGLFLGVGLEAGRPMTALAQARLVAHGRPGTWASLPVLIIVLWGGFITNLVWSAILILRNRSAKQFVGEPGVNPMRAVATSGDTLVDFDPLDPSTYDRLAPSTLIANYCFAALAGVAWYLSILFYFMGVSRTDQAAVPGGGVFVGATLVFAALWGLMFKEWRGTSAGTKALVMCGLAVLVISTVAMGYGNSLHAVIGR